ncbi:hypothetical protein [Halovivax cerinus]|uniref:Small CPxCG-related zinc finger protein n=1 Tax=Halovivax cerinus TaxID=1487865 RepID=A0ABD5NST4_9EURY|nr:hypothetical protein [Halovivax cerinus]
MRSIESAGGGTRDTSRTRECYRCDRDVAPQLLFRVDVQSPDHLSEKYADSVRYCCEHCAAAMNLSDFSDRWKAHAKRE